MTYYIARDGYGDLAICEETEPMLRKCDLPSSNRDHVWDVLVEALEAEEVPRCAAIVWHGNRWGDTPEPDEMCDEDAVPGQEFCGRHADREDV